MTNPESRRDTADLQPGRVYIHPLPVRIWHWANALGFVLLILTGIQIRYADLFNVISFELATELHNWIGIVVTANWFLWFFYYLVEVRGFSATDAGLIASAQWVAGAIGPSACSRSSPAPRPIPGASIACSPSTWAPCASPRCRRAG